MMRRRLQSLEFLRAACALSVLLNHLFDETTGLALHPVFVGLFSLGVEAVVGFFVLSGCVISLQHYASRLKYLRARLLRILPIYYVALGGSVVLMLLVGERFTNTELGGNVSFLQSLFWEPLRPLRFYIPSWSLSYELYYYLAFLALLAWPRLLLPLIAASLAAGVALYFLPPTGPEVGLLHPLSLYCLWLAGVLVVALCRRGLALSLPSAAWLLAIGLCLTRLPLSTPAKFDFFRLLGFGVGFAALVWALLAAEFGAMEERPARTFEIGLVWRCLLAVCAVSALWRFSHSHAATKAAITAAVALFTIAPDLLSGLVARLVRPILPFMLYVAGLSYALYLVHYPLLQAFNSLTALPPPARVAIVAALSFALAHLLEYKFQPWLRRKIEAPLFMRRA
jgi:peptidoglycan/LPS O-acetylase OafA/YrhL